MSSVFIFVQLCSAAVFYYGFFPLLYFLSFRKKTPWAYFLLAAGGGLFLWAVGGTPFASYLWPVVLTAFVLPGVIIILAVERNISPSKIFLWSHLPILIMALVFMLNPIGTQGLEVLLVEHLSKAEVLKSLEQLESPERLIQQIATVLARLFYGAWSLDLSSRLIVGAYILTRVRAGNKPPLSPVVFHRAGFADWPVWIVAGGLAGLLMGWSFGGLGGLIWPSGTVLLILLPLYFLRGIKVMLLKMFRRPAGPYLKFFLVLLVLIFWHYIVVSVAFIGLLDTWLDFNKPRAQEREGE